MNLTRDRLHSIGWVFVLTICIALTGVLTLRVNAMKSQVYQTERKIIAMQRDIIFLETEFETRSNQQQLKALNDVEFGYTAPKAEQYIEGERQLAALGKPPAPGAPSPIRMASIVPEEAGGLFPALVSPITGKTSGASADGGESVVERAARPEPAQGATSGQSADPVRAAIEAADLGNRLARIDVIRADNE